MNNEFCFDISELTEMNVNFDVIDPSYVQTTKQPTQSSSAQTSSSQVAPAAMALPQIQKRVPKKPVPAVKLPVDMLTFYAMDKDEYR